LSFRFFLKVAMVLVIVVARLVGGGGVSGSHRGGSKSCNSDGESGAGGDGLDLISPEAHTCAPFGLKRVHVPLHNSMTAV
jgi:hypothetical protein